MIRDDDIADIIFKSLEREKRDWRELVAAKEPKFGFYSKEPYYIKPYTSLPRGRFFLTEYELKQIIKDGKKEIRLPKNSIISPQAWEIIHEKNIKIIYE
jgi:hypothetical protein